MKTIILHFTAGPTHEMPEGLSFKKILVIPPAYVSEDDEGACGEQEDVS